VNSSAPFERVLVDTGPLVALLRRNDVHHQLCRETMRLIRPPLITCWPVLTEAAWLLRDRPRALAQSYSGAKAGVFQLIALDEHCLESIGALAKQYQGLRPQLADLALLHLAEREGIETVLTLDRRDFTAFKLKNRKPFRLLPESL